MRMKPKTKIMQTLAGISILLILCFMVLALLQYQNNSNMDLPPEKLELFLETDWTLVTLDRTSMPIEPADAQNSLQTQIQDALAALKGQKVILPFTEKSGPDAYLVFQNKIPLRYAGLSLGISCENSNIQVMVDKTEIYQRTLEDTAHNKASNQNMHYIDIPDTLEEGELWIILSSASPHAAASLEEVKIETHEALVIGVVESNIMDIGCCLLILIMSIIMFVLALIRRYTRQPQRGELFLGLAGLAADIYCFIWTDTLNIFYSLQEAYEMQEYLALLVPLLLALYFERNLHTIYPRRFSVLLCGMIIHSAAQIILQLLGIYHMQDMANLTAAAVGIVCITALITLIHYDYKNKSFQTLLSVLSILVLLTGGIANICANFIFDHTYANAAGQYSMAIFSVMMTVMHILRLSKEYRAKAEENAALLQEKIKATQQQNIQLAQAKKDADAARHEALAANEAKGNFLAHMSHEIRTPINAVLGMDEMILRESSEPQVKEYAMDIYTAGQTLLSLINDILDFSKIESGKMEIVPVEYDFCSLIHDLANMAAQRAKDKPIRLELEISHEIPSRLYGDDIRLRQILTNILTNAVKYTPKGTVWLRAQCRTTADTALLRFEVEDTGIGIKEEDLPKLSAEFERIEEDRNRNIEGTGLGMSITIQLLTLLGSQLQVESTYEKGSKFYFALEQKIVDHTPIGDFEARVQQLTDHYQYSTNFCAPNASILVVDDNAVNRKVFRSLLKATKIQVTDAPGGAECLKLVQENHYDLIFLDHMMPEMDGIETLRHIRTYTDFPCRDTPIIVLTANAVSGAREKYLAEGFDAFLSKPIVPQKLETMIQNMLPQELLQQAEQTGADTGTRTQAALPQTDKLLDDLPQVDGLDWQYAWLHLPDMELLASTVKEFYAQIFSAADRLEDAYRQVHEPAYLDQYRIQVHAMKSLAASVGIIPLSGTAKILEYAARDGRIDIIESMTAAFLEEWRSYRQKLHGVFGIAMETKKEITDASVIQALLEMVRIHMQEMDIDQADELIQQLQAYAYPADLEQQMQKLAEAVTNLDPEETERLSDVMIAQMEQFELVNA